MPAAIGLVASLGLAMLLIRRRPSQTQQRPTTTEQLAAQGGSAQAAPEEMAGQSVTAAVDEMQVCICHAIGVKQHTELAIMTHSWLGLVVAR